MSESHDLAVQEKKEAVAKAKGPSPAATTFLPQTSTKPTKQ
jgi:hypothetical protein